MIECKTFTFESISVTEGRGGVIDEWMDKVCTVTPFVDFELKAIYQDDAGRVICTYFAMKSDRINPFYEFRHLALQKINLN